MANAIKKAKAKEDLSDDVKDKVYSLDILVGSKKKPYRVVNFDKRNFAILEETFNRDTGIKTGWKVAGYYGFLEHLIKDLLKKKLRHSDIKNLKEVVEYIKKFEKTIEENKKWLTIR